LEYDLHLPPQQPEILALEVGDLPAVKEDPACGGLKKSDQKPPRGRLSAAAFPSQGEDLPPLYRKADPVDRLEELRLPREELLEEALLDREVLDEILDPSDLAQVRAPPSDI